MVVCTDAIRIAVLGCGPAFETVVLVAALYNMGFKEPVRFTLIDKEAAWQPGYNALEVNYTFHHVDLEEKVNDLGWFEELGKQHDLIVAW